MTHNVRYVGTYLTSVYFTLTALCVLTKFPDKFVAAIVSLAVVMLLILLIIAIITFQRTKGRVGASMEMHVSNGDLLIMYWILLMTYPSQGVADRYNSTLTGEAHNRPLVDSSI